LIGQPSDRIAGRKSDDERLTPRGASLEGAAEGDRSRAKIERPIREKMSHLAILESAIIPSLFKDAITAPALVKNPLCLCGEGGKTEFTTKTQRSKRIVEVWTDRFE
jgi:hypothetical protein